MRKNKRVSSIEEYLRNKPIEKISDSKPKKQKVTDPSGSILVPRYGDMKRPYVFKRIGDCGWTVDYKDQRQEIPGQLEIGEELC